MIAKSHGRGFAEIIVPGVPPLESTHQAIMHEIICLRSIAYKGKSVAPQVGHTRFDHLDLFNVGRVGPSSLFPAINYCSNPHFILRGFHPK